MRKKISQKTFQIFGSLSLIFLFLFSLPVQAQNPSPLTQGALEDLVAPIALYPDPLLAQILPASTYPLEIVQAARLIKSKKDFHKIDGQDWDPSVKAVARYPEVLKKMNQDLEWTEDLGNAFLDQEEDLMRAIQNKRYQAKDAGYLKSGQQQTIYEEENYIEIVPTNPEVIYVPTYDTRVVYVDSDYYDYYPSSGIHFSIGYSSGVWLDTGFYWPTRRVFYSGYDWWRRDHRHRGSYSDHNRYRYWSHDRPRSSYGRERRDYGEGRSRDYGHRYDNNRRINEGGYGNNTHTIFRVKPSSKTNIPNTSNNRRPASVRVQRSEPSASKTYRYSPPAQNNKPSFTPPQKTYSNSKPEGASNVKSTPSRSISSTPMKIYKH